MRWSLGPGPPGPRWPKVRRFTGNSSLRASLERCPKVEPTLGSSKKTVWSLQNFILNGPCDEPAVHMGDMFYTEVSHFTPPLGLGSLDCDPINTSRLRLGCLMCFQSKEGHVTNLLTHSMKESSCSKLLLQKTQSCLLHVKTTAHHLSFCS